MAITLRIVPTKTPDVVLPAVPVRDGRPNETIVETDAMSARAMPLPRASVDYGFCTVWLTAGWRRIADRQKAASEYITQHNTHHDCPPIPLCRIHCNMNVTEFVAREQIICGMRTNKIRHKNNLSR